MIVNATADAVWEVVAHRFDRIGEWATVIPSSAATAEPSGVGAPVAGRVCHTGLRLAPEVTESVVVYDDTERTLTYQATAGLPAFLAMARNHWRVWWVLLLRVRRTGRHLLADLKHGTPSARKLRRQARARG